MALRLPVDGENKRFSLKVFDSRANYPTCINLYEFLFASLDEVRSSLKWGLLLMERICSSRSKFFPLKVEKAPISTEEGGKRM